MEEQIQKLSLLEPRILATALVRLATTSEAAEETVARLLLKPHENMKQFKRNLSQLEQLDYFIHWREVEEFAEEMAMMLEGLKAAEPDPLEGVKLAAAFLKTDLVVLENSDDSNTALEVIYSENATDLLLEFARECSEKQALAEILFDVCQENEYGTRDGVIAEMGSLLPEALIREKIEILQRLAAKQEDFDEKDQILEFVAALAKQVKDPELYRVTRLEIEGKESTSAQLDIAQMYFENDTIPAALEWLDKIRDKKRSHGFQMSSLYMDIYRKQGDGQRLKPLLLERFRSFYEVNLWEELLQLVGKSGKKALAAQETAFVLNASGLNEKAAKFLIAIGKLEEAETYLVQRHALLEGEAYFVLLPLAEALAAHECVLGASLIYRKLLTSILERGFSRAYPHGIRYLLALDQLAPKVSNWQQFENHEVYKSHLYQAHRLKRSFWPEYNRALPNPSKF